MGYELYLEIFKHKHRAAMIAEGSVPSVVLPGTHSLKRLRATCLQLLGCCGYLSLTTTCWPEDYGPLYQRMLAVQGAVVEQHVDIFGLE